MSENLRRLAMSVRERVETYGHAALIQPYDSPQARHGPAGFQVLREGYMLRWYVLRGGVFEFVLSASEGDEGTQILILDYHADGPLWGYVVQADEGLSPIFDFIAALKIEEEDTGRGPDLNWHQWNELLEQVIDAFTAATD